MIIVRLEGGLGNQLFQYALGRRLAMERRVPLKLDLRWFKQHNLRQYQLGGFKIYAEIASVEDIEKITKSNLSGIPGKIFRGIQRIIPYYSRRKVKEKAFTFDKRIINYASRNAYLVGFWQSEKYFTPMGDILRNEIRSINLLSSSSQRWLAKIQPNTSISLHVRRGDYVSNVNNDHLHRACSIEYFQSGLNYLSREFPEGNFFIFSDDLDWCEHNLGFLPGAEFIWVDGKNRDVEELILMSYCKHHIISNSTYSWWGAWLNPSPKKMIIAPHIWFNDPEWDTRDLIPASWVRL